MRIKIQPWNTQTNRFVLELMELSGYQLTGIQEIIQNIEGLRELNSDKDSVTLLGSSMAINQLAKSLNTANVINSDDAVSISRRLDNLEPYPQKSVRRGA